PRQPTLLLGGDGAHRPLHSFPTRRSSDLTTSLKQRWEELKSENPHLRIRNAADQLGVSEAELLLTNIGKGVTRLKNDVAQILPRSEEHTSELQSRENLVCRLLLDKKKDTH